MGAKIAVFTILILATTASAADPDPRRERRNGLVAEARRLQEEGKLAHAHEAGSRALALEQAIFGEVHESIVGTKVWLAGIEKSLGDADAAARSLARALEIRTELSGPDHWKTTDLRIQCESMELRRSLTVEERALVDEADRLNARLFVLYRQGRVEQTLRAAERALEIREEILGPVHLDTAKSLNNLGFLYQLTGEFEKALPRFERTRRIFEQVVGPEHPDTATCLNNLAELHKAMGEHRKALPLHERALAIREKALGPEHPDTAMSLSNLALLHESMGNYEAALPLCIRALAIHERVLGPDHIRTAVTLNALAGLYRSMGDYGEALPLYERSLSIRERSLGPGHLETAESRNNLAALYHSMGEYEKALALYQRSLSIQEQVLGSDNPHTAVPLGNLASLYLSMGESEKALPFYRRALAIQEKALGPEHPDTAMSLSNLALLHESMGEPGKGLPLLERAVSIWEKALGPEHPRTALGLNNLGYLYQSMGESGEALPFYERALSIRERVLGPEHPDTAQTLGNLGALYRSLGQSERAEPLFERSLSIYEGALSPEHPDTARCLRDFTVLHGEAGRPELARPLAVRALKAERAVLRSLAALTSERQQLRQFADVTDALDLCLSTGRGEDGAALHDLVLTTKGLVFRRQAWLRAERARPELSGLFAEYEGVCRGLAGLLLATPKPEEAEARRMKFRELRERQEDLEVELAAKSEVFRKERDSGRLTSAEFAACLPEGAVLVDLLAYDQLLPREEGVAGPTRWEKRYVAFVVRPDAETVRVDLGAAARIDALVQKWRAEVRAGAAASAGRRLRELVWEPLMPHVGNARTVLVSPDGALSRVPFAALPGAEPGSWLIDEHAFAIVPVPRLLPALLAGRDPESATAESLLLVGEVDYGAAAGAPEKGLVAAARAAPRDGLRGSWQPLAATRSEVLAVRDSFELRFLDGETDSLRRTRATEEAFRAAAGRHRWLHVATHGFFAPKQVTSALADAGRRDPGDDRPVVGFHPGLLSGIVLAGANRPMEDGDDGILTALEVASLDFSGTELVTLSACETGLGEVAGGEGVLGLQRAFQMAGARSTVTSLWKVDDRITSQLMTIFYEKLWDEGLPKARALRQAQLELMRDEGMRGLAVKDATEGETPTRLPPLYWAGFTLSGDWR